ncbi:MAG: type IV pilus modification PilV family protein [Hyphomicrobiales bacterium]
MKMAFWGNAVPAKGEYRIRDPQQGYLLLEIMVAVVIFTIGFLAVGTMIISTTRNNTTSNILTQATLLAEETLEDLKKQDLAKLITGGSYNDPQNPIDEWGNTGGIYKRSWVIDDPVGLNTSRRIRVTVNWQRLGQTRRLELTTITRGNGT